MVVAILTLGLQNISAKGIADKEILSKISHYDGYTRDVRRHLHFYPEVGGHETETAKFLKAELAKIGSFDIHDVPGSTGFYAIFDTMRVGKTVGLRTDIDGLPINESTLNGGGKPKPFLSKNAGVTQGCGHDGHMTVFDEHPYHLRSARPTHRKVCIHL